MFKRLWKRKETSHITAEQLEEHLDCIKVRLLEIRGFHKKKIVKSPTYHYTQPIDIEEAWSSVQNKLTTAYEQLCQVAECIQVEYETMPPTTTFGRALDQFANLIDRMALFLEEHGVPNVPETTLEAINAIFLQLQQTVNLLNRRVMVDFVFTREPR